CLRTTTSSCETGKQSCLHRTATAPRARKDTNGISNHAERLPPGANQLWVCRAECSFEAQQTRESAAAADAKPGSLFGKHLCRRGKNDQKPSPALPARIRQELRRQSVLASA